MIKNCAENTSQHRAGRALDFDIVGLTAQEVRDEIDNNLEKFRCIGGIERGVCWVHLDLRQTLDGKVLYFNPKG